MALKELLESKKNDLRFGRFTSEAAVSQGIVLPLLNELENNRVTSEIISIHTPT